MKVGEKSRIFNMCRDHFWYAIDMQIVGNPARAEMVGGAQVIQAGAVGIAQRLIRQDMVRYLDTMQHTPGGTYRDVTGTLELQWQKAHVGSMMGLAGAVGSGITPFLLLPAPPLVQAGLALVGVVACSMFAHRQSQRAHQVAAELGNLEQWTGTVVFTEQRYQQEAAKLKAAKQEELQQLKESLTPGAPGIDERAFVIA
ncbi:MAG: hypothetical protein ACYCW6_18160 [Candidatus Xenobia bacterium]